MTKENPAFPSRVFFFANTLPIMPAAVAWSGMVPHGVALTGLLLMLRVGEARGRPDSREDRRRKCAFHVPSHLVSPQIMKSRFCGDRTSALWSGYFDPRSFFSTAFISVSFLFDLQYFVTTLTFASALRRSTVATFLLA